MSSNCPRTRFLVWILKYTQKPHLIFLFAALTLTFATSARAATLVVTKTADTNDGVCDADCSLREAVGIASSNGEDDTIVFDQAVFSTENTIILSTEIVFARDPSPSGGYTVSVLGPGRELLALSGGGTSRIFSIQNHRAVYIEGLTFTNGFAVSGGAIHSTTSHVTIVSSTFISNTAEGLIPVLNGNFYGAEGGAIAAGRVTIANSSFQNNVVRGKFGLWQGTFYVGIGLGGALRTTASNSLIINCSFENNVAQGADGPGDTPVRDGGEGSGGAIYGASIVISSEFVSNRAEGGDGVGGVGSVPQARPLRLPLSLSHPQRRPAGLGRDREPDHARHPGRRGARDQGAAGAGGG